MGIQGQNTDPAKAKELLQQANAMGYEIKFLYATDDPLSVAAKDQIVKGLEAGGFKATPIASTSDKIREARTDYKSPINVRSSGWCSDWPSGGSWFPAQWDGSLVGLEGMPNPSNFKEADADQMQKDILDGKKGDPTKAWGEFDKFLETTYYPAVEDRLLRHRDHPGLQDRRHVQRQRPRHADLRDDVRDPVVASVASVSSHGAAQLPATARAVQSRSGGRGGPIMHGPRPTRGPCGRPGRGLGPCWHRLVTVP